MKKNYVSYEIIPLCNEKVNSTISLFIGKGRVFKNIADQISNTKNYFNASGEFVYSLNFLETKLVDFKLLCNKNKIAFKRC